MAYLRLLPEGRRSLKSHIEPAPNTRGGLGRVRPVRTRGSNPDSVCQPGWSAAGVGREFIGSRTGVGGFPVSRRVIVAVSTTRVKAMLCPDIAWLVTLTRFAATAVRRLLAKGEAWSGPQVFGLRPNPSGVQTSFRRWPAGFLHLCLVSSVRASPCAWAEQRKDLLQVVTGLGESLRDTGVGCSDRTPHDLGDRSRPLGCLLGRRACWLYRHGISDHCGWDYC